MKLNMHQATVAPCIRALSNLNDILAKAEQHAADKKIDAAVLLNSRLFPDMLPLKMQIVIAGDIARGGSARLAGAEVPSFEAGTASFKELTEGLRRTIGYLEALQPGQFDGAEDRTITWQTRSSSKQMQGTAYLFYHVLPNVYFHVTTAYDILRQSGVVLGKKDYLGNN